MRTFASPEMAEAAYLLLVEMDEIPEYRLTENLRRLREQYREWLGGDGDERAPRLRLIRGGKP